MEKQMVIDYGFVCFSTLCVRQFYQLGKYSFK